MEDVECGAGVKEEDPIHVSYSCLRRVGTDQLFQKWYFALKHVTHHVLKHRYEAQTMGHKAGSYCVTPRIM